MRLRRSRRLLRWVDRQMRIWWPVAAALIAGAILATLGLVVRTVLDGRDEDQLRNDQLGELVEQQATIIERDRRLDARGDALLRDAIAEVEALVADQFARHDTNSATVHNDLLAQIAALLGRPAGVTTDPVAARDVDPPPRSPDDERQPPPPADEPRDEPTTTTTTTQPGRSGLCDRIPITPICRSPR